MDVRLHVFTKAFHGILFLGMTARHLRDIPDHSWAATGRLRSLGGLGEWQLSGSEEPLVGVTLR
jgi:hypothetical protein